MFLVFVGQCGVGCSKQNTMFVAPDMDTPYSLCFLFVKVEVLIHVRPIGASEVFGVMGSKRSNTQGLDSL